MARTGKILRCFIIITALITGGFEPISAEYIPLAYPVILHKPIFVHVPDELWAYLRLGLNYLESPQPLARPEAIPPAYIHPDGRGFGAYGFSPEAYDDVRQHYAFFQDYTWEEIIDSAALYDLANQAFADLLLKHLQDYIPEGADRKTVFLVLHQAWNLGLSGFKRGRQVVSSRTRRAQEFLTAAGPSS